MQNDTDTLHARLARARRMRHQARLIQDGRVVAAGPWRSDHLAAVVDRNRIRQYQREQSLPGAAEITTTIGGEA